MPLLRRVFRRAESEIFVSIAQMRGVEMDRTTRFVGRPIIDLMPGSRIHLGARGRFISDGRVATLGVGHPVILRTMRPGASISIGSDVGMTGGAICAAVRISIGDGALLGADVVIADTDFHPLDSDARRYAPLPVGRPEDEVRIGSNVFIGTRSLILKGADIGENSVIGAGSVVSGPIPSGTVAAGVPARVLRELTRVAPPRI